MNAWFVRISALLFLLVATHATAQNTYSAYIDSDSNAATGCTITLPGGTFTGADWRVQATATTGNSAQVTGVTLAPCNGGTFGAGTTIGGGYPVGLNNGTGGADVVEFSTPAGGIIGSGSYAVTLGFTAENATGSDVLFAVDGDGGAAIVLGNVAPTPLLGAGALVLLALLVLLIARRHGRGRLYSRVLGLSLLAIYGIALAATFIDDGQVGDWSGIGPIATDPTGDPSNGSPDIDLVAAFAAVDGGKIHFRLDVADMQTQAPTITSANNTTFVVGTPGSFTVTALGVPTPALSANCTPALPAGVTFTDNGNGSATLAGTPPSGSAGTYSCALTASNGIPPDAMQTFTLTIANAPSTTTLTADINPSVYGQTVTFTATVAAATPPGPATPTGTVTFFDGAANIGSGTLNGSGVATLATGNLSVATHTITAQYGGDVNYGTSTSNTVSQVVNQAATTTSVAPDVNPSVFGQTVTFTATVAASAPGAGTPTGTVTFKDGAATLGTGTLAGGTATLSTASLSVATHPITVVYAGDANFTGSTSSTVNQVVNQAATTTGVTSDTNPSMYNQNVTFTATVAASAPGAGTPSGTVTFKDGAATLGTGTLAGGTATFSTAGLSVATHSITAAYGGDTNFQASTSAALSQVVNKADQTITFTSTAPAAAVVNGPTYTVTATASSGLTVAFTIDASASTVCSIAGSTVSFIGAGTCVIDANQAGDANYNAAPQAQQSFTVSKNNQTITFTSTAPAAAQVGGATYTVTATASSGLTVAFTIDASASTVCSIAGSTVSFIGAGTCVIDANQAGDANYNPAPQVQQSFAVAKGNQTITFTSTAPAAAQVGGATYTVTATATSGLTVAFTIDASASTVCSIAGSTVSFIGAGTCVIDANQAGDANWNAAPQVQQSFAVAKGDQTISFTSTAPAGAQYNGPTYTVTATATSGLTVTFTIDASATSVCTIAGSTVSFIGVGTCVIDANQAGDANWNAAPQVQQSFAVSKADQTITFTSTAPAAAVVNGPTYTVTATATSGLTVTFTIDATATSVCSIAGSTVSFTASGTCVIDANQAGNANYNAAPQAQQSFLVNKADQTITFTSTAPATAKNGGATYTVTATATSGLTVTFSSGAPGICSVVGSTVSFIGAGTCIVNADQAGNAAYNPAPQVQQSFLVAKGDQTITFTSTLAAYSATGTTYTATATATSGLTVTFTIDGTSTSGCTIAGSVVSFATPIGSCIIDANQAGDANWNPAPQVQQSTTVEVPVSATDDAHAVTGNVAISVAASGVLGNDSGNPIAINSFGATGTENTTLGTATATAQGGSVTLNADGSYTFTPKANFNGTDTFKYVIGNDVNTSTGTVTLTVSDRIMVVTTVGGGNCVPATPCTLAVADAAASVSPNNDLVYVESGTYNAATFSMTSHQTLVGQVVDLATAISDAGITLAPDSVGPTNIAAATRPTFNNSASVISLAGSNLVEYFNINPSGGSAILSNAVTTGATVHDVTVTGTGSGAGVNITGTSTGSTFNFSNLVITTAAGNAFTAVGPGPGAATGGTLNITTGSTPNTLTSTTGTALSVTNTTIGASGLTFQSITTGTAASGPTNAIVLNNTGASGGLSVTGTGSAGSGGTIQKSSGDAILMTSVKAPSLSWMNIINNTGSGIRGDFVNGGLNFDHLMVAGNSTAASNCVLPPAAGCQAGIFLYDLLGTGNVISNSSISGAYEDNVHVENDGANVLGALMVSNNTIADNSPTTGNDGLQLLSHNTSSMTVTATSNTFHGNRATSILADASDASTLNVTLTSNNIYDAGGGTNQGNIGIDVDGSGTSNVALNVSSNIIGKNGAANAPLMNHGINVFFGSTVNGGSVTGNVSNNTIHNAGTGFSGFGIRVFPANGNSVWRLRVDGNTIDNVGLDYGLFVGSGEQSVTGATNVQVGVLNNTVSVLATALDAIRVQARVNGSTCARITGNTGVQPGGSCGGVGFCGIYTRQANAAVFNLEGGTGAVATNNPLTAAAQIGTIGTITTQASGFCSQIP